MNQTIKVSDLNVSYYGNHALKNVSFSLPTGNLIGIIGPNGAGKSTLIKAMLHLIPIEHGSILINGQPVKDIRRNIAYVPQRNNIDWDFPITVKDAVLLGTYPNIKLFRRPTKNDKDWSLHCLEKVGLSTFANRQIAELSGGQQQRVFLARALAQKTDFLFLDEPFVGVDVASEEMIINILKKLRDEGKTIMVVNHDLTKVEAYFDQLILLNNILVAAGSVQSVIKPENMSKAYNTNMNLIQQMGVFSL